MHAISSISAMVQLVQGGFGVALLPRAVVARLKGFAKLKPLAVDAKVEALPIHASYRMDPTSDSVEVVLETALEFTNTVRNAPKKNNKGKP